MHTPPSKQLKLSTGISQFVLLLAVLSNEAFALDPKQPANGYIRTNFTIEDGLPSNAVNALAETQNGFLWIGTDNGLARFNGRRFTPIYFRGPQSTPQGIVSALALAPNGDLWVGTGTGLARILKDALDASDRSLAAFFHPGAAMSDEINCLRFSRDGLLWIGTNSGLYRFDGSQITVVVPQVSVNRLEETRDGHMLITCGKGFMELDNSRIVEHTGLPDNASVPTADVFHVFEDRSGARWFCTKEGLFRKVGDGVAAIGPRDRAAAFRIVEDRQDNLWVFAQDGLFRASSTGLELAAAGFGAACAFADSEGNLWVGGKGAGLFRFKDRLIRMIKPLDGLKSTVPMTVLSDREGRLWVGNNCGGLSLFDGIGFKTYAEKDGLLNSCVWALAEDAQNDLWVGTWGGGVFRFRKGEFTQYKHSQGLVGDIVKAIVPEPDGSLWIATDDGLSHMQNGKFRNFTTADGLSSNRVVNIFRDRRGGIWVATREGVNHLVGDRFTSVPSTPKIFDNHYIGLGEDSSGNVYALAAPKGISRVKDRLLSTDVGFESLSMVGSGGKNVWLTGANGIFRLPEAELQKEVRDPEEPVDYGRFGREDGLSSPQCTLGVPNMAIHDGHLWVTTVQGVAMLDLARLQAADRTAAPFLDEITIGRIKQPAGRELTVPPGVHHVELHFDSIELTAPEKVRFQYRLDDVDSSWLDADSTRSAVYTGIPIGTHRFHVRACNKDGIWDRAGIVFPITQQPYFYETTVFKAAVIGSAAFALLSLYRMRLRYLAREIQGRLQERVSERERIARELHDTLLQSFHGLMFRFQAVQNLLPERPVEALTSLEIAIDRAAKAITEGRDAVQDLRRDGDSSLVQSLTNLGKELRENHGTEAGQTPAAFDVVVEGEPRVISSLLRHDLYGIGREAVANAFRHAGANRIEVEIRFDDQMLRLRVRDDGVGMDPKLLAGGVRSGHWGLTGMRERANKFGGRLEVWSVLGQGTEVEIAIPAALAYGKSGDRPADDIDTETGDES